MCEIWNSKITTIQPYRNLIGHLSLNKIPNDIYLFRGERVVKSEEALERFFYLHDAVCVIKDSPIDTLVINLNRLTPSKLLSCQNKLKNNNDDKFTKLLLLDALFKYELPIEEPSDDKGKYYNPWTKVNYTQIDNFRYKSKSLRIVCNSEQEFYHYLLSEFNTIDDFDDALFKFITKKERVNLDTMKAITLEELKSMKYYNENLGIGTNYKKLYDRLLPYIESIFNPKKQRKTLSKGLKTDLWDKYYPGKLIGPCYVCSKDIDARNFEAGHVIPVAKGGSDTIDNLRPICRKCNGSMSDTDLYEYKKRYYSSLEDKIVLPTISDWVDLGTTEVQTKYVDKLFFHKLYRVRLKDINEDYKEWCKNNNIKDTPKSLELIFSEKKCEKVTDTLVYYSGVCLNKPCGMSELERLSFIKLTSGYKDDTKVLRDLQRRNANIQDIIELLKIKEIPQSIKDVLLELI